MQLGTLISGQKFKVVGWENGPILSVRYGTGDPANIHITEPNGDFVELKTGVIVDCGGIDISKILKTTYIFPATTKVKIIK